MESACLADDVSEGRLVPGDLDILCCYGDDGHPRWAARQQAVFDRTAVIDLDVVVPEVPNCRGVPTLGVNRA